MKKIHYTLLLFFLIAITTPSFSQVYNKQNKKYRHWQKSQRFRKKYRYLMLGVSLGTMNYKGDLNPKSNLFSTDPKKTRWNIGAHIVWRYAPRVSFRGSFSAGRIEGSDEVSADPYGDVYSEGARYTRNLSFTNDIYELKGDVIVDFYENRKSMRRRMNWTPYASLGLAMFYNNPKAVYEGETYSLRELGTEGQLLDGGGTYSAFQIAIPFGLGIRYKLTSTLDIAFEFGTRFTLTDYLDDVSGNYVDKTKLGGPNDIAVLLSDRSIEKPVHDNIASQVGGNQWTDSDGYSYTTSYTAGQPRGNPKLKDWYFVTGFHLTYIFHPKTYAARYKG
jgi:hypothetical protein